VRTGGPQLHISARNPYFVATASGITWKIETEFVFLNSPPTVCLASHNITLQLTVALVHDSPVRAVSHFHAGELFSDLHARKLLRIVCRPSRAERQRRHPGQDRQLRPSSDHCKPARPERCGSPADMDEE